MYIWYTIITKHNHTLIHMSSHYLLGHGVSIQEPYMSLHFIIDQVYKRLLNKRPHIFFIMQS